MEDSDVDMEITKVIKDYQTDVRQHFDNFFSLQRASSKYERMGLHAAMSAVTSEDSKIILGQYWRLNQRLTARDRRAKQENRVNLANTSSIFKTQHKMNSMLEVRHM